MKLIFYTHYYDNSNVEYIIPTPSIKYKSYYYTNNLIMYNKLSDTSWNRVLDISLNIPYIDPMIYQLYVLEYGLPVDPVLYEEFILRWYKRPKITTQYSILNNPQYYVDVSSADYLCIINYKTYTINEKYIETFILKYFINNKQYCLLYKRYNVDMELLLINVKHRDINKSMAFLKTILSNDKDTYIL